MQHHGVVESEVDIHYWDLGSIPRSPKCLFIFFLTQSHAGFLSVSHHTPHPDACHVATTTNPVVKRGRPWYVLVNAGVDNSGKSNKGLSLMGQIASPHLQKGPEPPFGSFLFFFSFYFFYFVCLLIIFLIIIYYH